MVSINIFLYKFKLYLNSFFLKNFYNFVLFKALNDSTLPLQIIFILSFFLGSRTNVEKSDILTLIVRIFGISSIFLTINGYSPIFEPLKINNNKPLSSLSPNAC